MSGVCEATTRLSGPGGTLRWAGLRVLLWPIPVPPGWGVLAHVSVDLEVLEVFCVGVSVVGGAEPEAWSTCLPVSLVVDDNLAHD